MNSAVDFPASTSKRSRCVLILTGVGLITLLLIVIASCRFHWHERAWYYASTQLNASQWVGRSVWLPAYQVAVEARPVLGVEDDLSAISFDTERKRLLAVTNAAPIKLLELDREGTITAQYPLLGFEDVEGLVYMGDGLLAVTDETQQQIVVLRLPPTPGMAIDNREASTLALPLTPSAHNKGFEGVAYDSANDRLFVAKERDPRQLYAVSGLKASLGGKLQLKVEDLSEWVRRSMFGKDISDLYFDEKTGHLLVLSDESKLVIELGSAGEVVSFRTLLGYFSDLQKSAPQPEGLTMDDQRDLYIVSEPNLFYRFSKH